MGISALVWPTHLSLWSYHCDMGEMSFCPEERCAPLVAWGSFEAMGFLRSEWTFRGRNDQSLPCTCKAMKGLDEKWLRHKQHESHSQDGWLLRATAWKGTCHSLGLRKVEKSPFLNYMTWNAAVLLCPDSWPVAGVTLYIVGKNWLILGDYNLTLYLRPIASKALHLRRIIHFTLLFCSNYLSFSWWQNFDTEIKCDFLKVDGGWAFKDFWFWGFCFYTTTIVPYSYVTIWLAVSSKSVWISS